MDAAISTDDAVNTASHSMANTQNNTLIFIMAKDLTGCLKKISTAKLTAATVN